MDKVEHKDKHWVSCDNCKGRGKIRRKLSNKVRLRYQKECREYMEFQSNLPLPVRPTGVLQTCAVCAGTGLVPSATPAVPDMEKYPHVAIVGGGIGGVALALACLHRQIPFTLFERDASFADRSQGYGLTLQQASSAMKALGVDHLSEAIVSTKHLVHTIDGQVVGEWGVRRWKDAIPESNSKRTNMHIARQSLRLALLDQLDDNTIRWGHQFVGCIQAEQGVSLQFNVNGLEQQYTADIVVGADGIRSAVREYAISKEESSLHYLGCMVILGICEYKDLSNVHNDLLDGKTVFQTANGTERIYMMPFSSTKIMWQLSFPLEESVAKELSVSGAEALKEVACSKTKWHSPIPQIINATAATAISGYPVYDRDLLEPHSLDHAGAITLIGDAAHPMSPFKGQGANQALLDALFLARKITAICNSTNSWKDLNIRESILSDFETEMCSRANVKVKGSAAAAQFLHSDIVLKQGDETVGAKWLSSLNATD